MGLIVSACFEIDLINQPRFAWFSKPSHGKGKRADYRGGWGGESIDFAVFFEIWKWFAHEATNHDCPEYYIFCRDVVSFQECFIVCLAFWKRKHVYIQ